MLDPLFFVFLSFACYTKARVICLSKKPIKKGYV